MNRFTLNASLRAIARLVPDVIPHLSPAARLRLLEPTEYKSCEFFLSALYGLVNGVYYNNIGGVFIDTMANLIIGELREAFTRAWADEGHFRELPDYLEAELEKMILQQYDYVDRFFRDIIDARIDGTPIEPLLYRAQLWANQWNCAYNEAMRLIALNEGGKLMWVEGDTGKKCEVCLALNGIIAYAREWDEIGVRPQSPPNALLACGGWRCLCKLVPTDKRRTRDAFNVIRRIVGTL